MSQNERGNESWKLNGAKHDQTLDLAFPQSPASHFDSFKAVLEFTYKVTFFSGFDCGIYVFMTWTHKAIELCNNKGLKLSMKLWVQVRMIWSAILDGCALELKLSWWRAGNHL